MDWTKEQADAINKKGSNILVAAAAGSGKTAVLVERIIQKIIRDRIDIDKLLVVTFTNAAASEMRERVLEAIYKKIDENPEDENLQRQIILLGKTSICTIHSFCLDVIKNNFFEVDLSASFRIGNEEEVELLKQEVIEEVFEELYELEDKNFIRLVETYTDYRGDEKLRDIVLKIYSFIQSAPFPEEWLREKIDNFKYNESQKDFLKTKWGQALIKNFQEELIYCINSLKIVKEKIDKHIELEKYSVVLSEDIKNLKELYDSCDISWDKAYSNAETLKFRTWPIDRKISMDLKDEAKNSRDGIKIKINKIKDKFLIYNSEEAFKDIYEMYEILENLKKLILDFDIRFKLKKREKNIVDFNDIEHYALKILMRKSENGEYIPTEVAKKYKDKFEEIAIDEYQDSNQVQEYILSSVSKGNNIFMVGDVKQSIYKFRQACPELFLNKYDNYSLDGNDNGLKIKLFKNFRSRQNILDVTNIVFESIMSKELGSIDYTEEEYLNLGAEYGETERKLGNAEIHIIDFAEPKEKDVSDSEEDSEEDNIVLEKEEIEAKFVARKIEEIISSKSQVKDKKLGLRDVSYKDIAILLRSTSKIAPIYERELIKRNIPVFSDSSNEYLDTMEIQTIMNVLKVLDNPIDDISLVSVLRSKIGNFTDNEIIEIRLIKKDDNFYNALISAKENLDGALKEKISFFLDTFDSWRRESDYLSLAELVWKIYLDTGFYNYVGLMPNGSLRQANLRMLFERAKEYEKTSFKGLFNFIRFIERLKISNGDMSSAKIIGENENVVRIMSIHKSKGLEFPIVFLSSTAKQMNMQDLKSDILLHQDMGIGPEYINYERRIEYSTLAKEAIKVVTKEEAIAEEMRILYVALTRAKEKLIITGSLKNLEEKIQDKKDNLKAYKSTNNKISPVLIKKYNSFLDWILLVLLNKNIEDKITLDVHKRAEVVDEQEKEEIELREFDFTLKTDFKSLEQIFNWKYPRLGMTKLPIKSTVSKIKEMQEDIDFEKLNKKEIGIENIKPIFMEDSENISSSQKGILMHLILQRIDFKKIYDVQMLANMVEDLLFKKIISENESKEIDINNIYNFLNSDFAKKIRNAKDIKKEKAFCIKLQAKDYFENLEDETILVQGIIDLYFTDEHDNIVLVDYKTDFAKEEQYLINKYKVQLDIYKRALEDGLNKKVSEVYIYSLYLNKEIRI